MAAKRPRLVLMSADTVGGVWHYAVELATALAARDVRVALATMGAPLTAAQQAQIATVPGARVCESSYKLEWMSGAWEDVERAGGWLLRLENELRPDVVHLNQFAFGALPFEAPKLVVAHSCVVSWWHAVCGMPPPREWDRYRLAVRDGLAGADLVAAPTKAMLDAIREHYGYEDAGVVIPNARRAESYPPGKKEPVILSAGRLWDDAKNLAALEAVAPRLPWPICVAGSTSGPGGGVRRPTGVHVLGDLAPEALARQLARASIYALPARYEPFGLSVLEAALAGCALVLGDIPSLREVWGDAALYVAPEDAQALRDCLGHLISKPATRAAWGRVARLRALEFTPERKARGYLSAYAAICGGRMKTIAAESRMPEGRRACAS